MNKLKIGIVGLGIGKTHIRGYRTHPLADVVAIADIDAARLQSVGDEFDIPNRYPSLAAMLNDCQLDAVSIATPNKFHHPLTIEALQAGCHVLCEKPMAMSAAEAREMIAAAKLAGKRLMINFNYRFNPQSMALKAQVEAGALGDIYFARTLWHRRDGLPGFGGWFGKKALSGGGPLIDLGVHRLDLALWLMGYPQPVWVMGSTYNAIGSAKAKEAGVDFDVEDMAVALIKFENGATLEIEASWAAHIKEQEAMETRLLGTRGGMIQYNLNEGYAWDAEIHTRQNGAHFDLKLHPPLNAVPPSMAHFVDTILNNATPIVRAEEGLLVMELLDAIYRSAKLGEPVKISPAA